MCKLPQDSIPLSMKEGAHKLYNQLQIHWILNTVFNSQTIGENGTPNTTWAKQTELEEEREKKEVISEGIVDWGGWH